MNKITLSIISLSTALGIGLSASACKFQDCDKSAHRGGGHFIKMADADSDGKLNLEEMKSSAKTRFTEGDVNKDGIITLDEMNTNIEAKFLAGDLNKDGYLDQTELREQFKEQFQK